MIKNILSILLLIIFISTVYSQGKQSDSKRTFSDDINLYFTSVENVLKAPSDWNSNDLIMFGGVISLISGSFLLDHEVNNFFVEDQTTTFNNFETLGYYYGSPISTVPASLALYFSGLAFNNNWLRETGLMMVETISVIAIIQVPASFVLGRVRPHSSKDNNRFNWFKGFQQKNASFISGHTAIAVGLSNILAHQIDNIFATVGLSTLAILTPLSRLSDNQHWFSDIIIGAAFGYFISDKIIALNECENTFLNSFTFSPNLNGISLIYNF